MKCFYVNTLYPLCSQVKPDAKRCLKNLKDTDGLFAILGDAIIAFMKEKPTPFLKNALASKVRE